MADEPPLSETKIKGPRMPATAIIARRSPLRGSRERSLRRPRRRSIEALRISQEERLRVQESMSLLDSLDNTLNR